MASLPRTALTFSKFSLLPTELRRRIWISSLPARVVEFPYVSLQRKIAIWEKEINYDPSLPEPQSSTASLTILGANYESYVTLNGLYKEMFGFNMPEARPDEELGSEGDGGGEVEWIRPYKGVRFNPDIDTLSMNTETCNAIVLYGKEGLAPLRFVEVFVADLYKLDLQTYMELGFPSIMKLFLNAPQLETICLMLGCPDYWWEEEELLVNGELVQACGEALRDYWDGWRDTEGKGMYGSDEEGRRKAMSDRRRWRSVVKVSLPKQTPLYTGPVITNC